MKDFYIPVSITTDGFIVVKAESFEVASKQVNHTYTEVNINELRANANFTVVNEDVIFKPFDYDDEE